VRNLLRIVLVVACCVVAAGQALASTITVFYGDADGFGVGATTTLDPAFSNASPGEAPLTDIQLIGDSDGFVGPAFAPTGNFDAYAIPAGETIIAATLTMSAGAWDVGAFPVDGANVLMLDGVAVPTSFFSLYTANSGNEALGGNAIETRSLVLPSTFFPLLADGLVSLNGTHLSEEDGSGSFQIDFLRLVIETQPAGPGPAPVPEPTSIALLGLGLAGMGARRWRQRKA